MLQVRLRNGESFQQESGRYTPVRHLPGKPGSFGGADEATRVRSSSERQRLGTEPWAVATWKAGQGD